MVFCLYQLKLGQLALQIVEARFLFFLGCHYDHTHPEQAKFRIFRIGQTRDVHCFTLMLSSLPNDSVNSTSEQKKSEFELSRCFDKEIGHERLFSFACLKEFFARKLLNKRTLQTTQYDSLFAIHFKRFSREVCPLNVTTHSDNVSQFEHLCT